MTKEFLAVVSAMKNMGFSVNVKEHACMFNITDEYKLANYFFGSYSESDEDMDAFLDECEGWFIFYNNHNDDYEKDMAALINH